jgi:hypothetical protein
VQRSTSSKESILQLEFIKTKQRTVDLSQLATCNVQRSTSSKEQRAIDRFQAKNRKQRIESKESKAKNRSSCSKSIDSFQSVHGDPPLIPFARICFQRDETSAQGAFNPCAASDDRQSCLTKCVSDGFLATGSEWYRMLNSQPTSSSADHKCS